MKKSRLLTRFTLLNLIAIIVAIHFLPDKIIVGFNANFLITEFMGKWYDVILPILAFIACFIIMLIDVRENGDVKHVYRYLIAYVAVAVCSFFSWTMIGIQFAGGSIGASATIPWTIVILFPVGYFMLANGVAIGDRMFREVSLYGFEWVKDNPETWQKTHRFAGKMSIFTGLVLFVLGVWNELQFHTLWIYLVAFFVWILFSFIFVFIYSRIVANKN